MTFYRKNILTKHQAKCTGEPIVEQAKTEGHIEYRGTIELDAHNKQAEAQGNPFNAKAQI